MENYYSVMNRHMLRFRPIAPKPAAGDNISGVEQDRRNGAFKFGRRTKRKYVRVRGRKTSKRKSTEEEPSSPPGKSGVDDAPPPERSEVTLQLLPVRSESEKSFCYSSSSPKFQDIITDRDLLDRLGGVSYKSDGGATAAATWIVVESVTDTYADGVLGLGFSEGEIVKNLQADTCPGFVSDGANNVVWINDAYRRMAAEAAAESEVLVRLVVRKKLPYFTPSFACRVRMVQQTKHGQKWNRIVTCDVWRMGFTGFAWKLDVQTAIGL